MYIEKWCLCEEARSATVAMKSEEVKLHRPLDILYAKVPLKTSDVFVRRLYVCT